MNTITSHPGEAAALIVAVTWAFAVILFKKSGENVHPLALNLFKCLLAFLLIIPTIVIMGKSYPASLTTNELFLLLFSGVLGIGISDSMFFRSLNLLGAGLSAIVDCLYSPLIIGLSVLMLGERLTLFQVIGTVMIISAIVTAVRIKSAPSLTKGQLTWGLIWGALAMLTMAISIVTVKPLLERTSLLWVTEIRLVGGILILLVILIFNPKGGAIVRTLYTDKGKIYTWAGSFIGGYAAMILWIIGMKYTQASIAAALNQTSNIFVFIFAALFLRERITLLKGIGIVLAVAGATIIVIEQLGY